MKRVVTNEIMKNAENSTELSKWNKFRIVNECISALNDLKIIE